MNGLQINTTEITENPPTIFERTSLETWLFENFPLRIREAKSLEDEIYEFIAKIENLIINFDRFPVSYNQMFLKGSLRYCWRALKRLNPYEHTDLLNRIKTYIFSIMPLCTDMKRVKFSSSYHEMPHPIYSEGQDNTLLSRLTLESTEKAFNYIQKLCKKNGLLPLLEKMTVREALKD